MPIMNSGSGKGIEIKCRRCGKMAKAEEFTVDYVYKMAVCPSCVKERKSKEAKSQILEKKEENVEHHEMPKSETPKTLKTMIIEDDDFDKEEPKKTEVKQPTSAASKVGSMFGFGMNSSKKQETQTTQQPKPQVAPVASSKPVMQTTTQSSPQKTEETVSTKIKHKCKKCGFEFKYDAEKNSPKACPYCNTGVNQMVFGKMNQ